MDQAGHPARSPSPATTPGRGRYGYPAGPGSRDLRFDLMRGFAMLSVVAAHLEFFSWANFLFWERLGLISAAELFVVTAGLVLGLVNRKVAEREGLGAVTERLWRRSFVLWRALVVVVLLVTGLRALGRIDVTAVTTFTDRFAGQSWPMIPPPETPWNVQLALALSMRVSPHQVQILGLYVVLLALAPLALWLLQRRLLGPFLALSWGVYAAGWLRPPDAPLLGMQWEFAFPLPLYQLLFTHALAVGFFRNEIAAWLALGARRRIVVGLSLVLYLGFFVLAQMTPNPSFPAWSRLGGMEGERWQALYDAYFVKKHPSPLRFLNVAVFFVAFYTLLTHAWRPVHAALGWLLIPLGEASLYVFLMHLPFILLIDQIPGYFDGVPAWDRVWPTRIWINTGLYVGTILGLWLLVRHKVLFGIVPR